MLLAALLVSLAGLTAQSSQSPDPIRVFVSAPMRDGFVDTSKGIQNSVNDLKKRLAKYRGLTLTTQSAGADIVLTVVKRGVGSEEFGQRLQYSEYVANPDNHGRSIERRTTARDHRIPAEDANRRSPRDLQDAVSGGRISKHPDQSEARGATVPRTRARKSEDRIAAGCAHLQNSTVDTPAMLPPTAHRRSVNVSRTNRVIEQRSDRIMATRVATSHPP